ncbi:MAG: hypothetical protein HY867_12205 [Chloroflexi bacterium]|nr:hypothetical protein [Chloroflexota bacterium]
MRPSRLFELSLISIVMAIYLYAAFSEAHNFVEWFIRDDAYFYFKVAQNISEGHGSTLDRINLANGYHPLWMLVCIPIFSLARFDLILPLRIMVVLSGLISAGTGVLLFRLVKRTLSTPAAVLAAAYWVFDYSIHYNVTMFGLETGITALTMTALLLAISKTPSLRGANGVSEEAIPAQGRGLLPREERPPRKDGIAIIALLAVAMTFSRLDTIFLALLAGAWILLRGTAMRTRLFLDVAIIVCAAFVSVAMRAGLPQYFEYARSAVLFAALGLAIQIPIFYFAGLYSSRPLIANRQSLIANPHLRFFTASILGSALVASLMIGLLTSGTLSGLPRSALIVYAGFVLVGTRVARMVTRASPEEVPLNWKNIFREGIQYYGILGGAVGTYMLFNKWMFGTFMPVSGQVKAWWGSLQGTTYGNPIASLAGFLGLERAEGQNAWGPVVNLFHDFADALGVNIWIALGILFAIVTLILFSHPQRSKRAAISMGLPLLFTASIAQLFYYTGQGYAGAKDWYWVSQMILFALLAALLFDLLTRPLRNSPSPIFGRGVRGEGIRGEGGIIWLITSILVLLYLSIFVTVIVRRMPYETQRAGQPYLDAASFLEANTEEGSLIGMTGGGNVAYFIQGRNIVNMDGLINSHEYFLALRAGRADEYLASIGLDYIFSNPDILQNAPYNGQFDEWSLKVSEFGKKDLLKYNP